LECPKCRNKTFWLTGIIKVTDELILDGEKPTILLSNEGFDIFDDLPDYIEACCQKCGEVIKLDPTKFYEEVVQNAEIEEMNP
jgi:predicted nucleic-acid-binding Zn-ribbon protein